VSDTRVDQGSSTVRLLRFDKVQRGAHWTNALLFSVLMFTAIPLYFGSFFGVVFPRHVIQEIHLWTGLALPLPIIVSLLGPWGQRMRDDVRRANVWTRQEIRWLRTLGRTPVVADKFNPGQKANVIFTGAAIVVLLATGYVLQWFRFFPVSWGGGGPGAAAPPLLLPGLVAHGRHVHPRPVRLRRVRRGVRARRHGAVAPRLAARHALRHRRGALGRPPRAALARRGALAQPPLSRLTPTAKFAPFLSRPWEGVDSARRELWRMYRTQGRTVTTSFRYPLGEWLADRARP
jgi:formate dehydrogenase subunit gamma